MERMAELAAQQMYAASNVKAFTRKGPFAHIEFIEAHTGEDGLIRGQLVFGAFLSTNVAPFSIRADINRETFQHMDMRDVVVWGDQPWQVGRTYRFTAVPPKERTDEAVRGRQKEGTTGVEAGLHGRKRIVAPEPPQQHGHGHGHPHH